MVPASVNDKYVIRFCVCAQNATDDDIGKYLSLKVAYSIKLFHGIAIKSIYTYVNTK